MPLLYKKHGHTAIMTLSRPQARNCWGQDYADGLIKHLDEANDDDEVRSVILTGDEAGGAFSAGANLRDPNTHNTRSAEALGKHIACVPQASRPRFETLQPGLSPTSGRSRTGV